MDEPTLNPDSPVALPRTLRQPWVVFLACLTMGLVLYTTRLFAFFAPAPILYLTLRLGIWPGLALLLIDGALLAWINPLDTCFLILSSGTACWIAGLYLRAGKKMDVSIFAGVLVSTLILGSLFGIAKIAEPSPKFAFVQNLKSELRENLDRFYTEMNQIIEKDRETPISPEDREQNRRFFTTWGMAIIPGGVVATTAMSLWIFLIFLRRSVQNLGFSAIYADLTRWQSPEFLIWAVILTLTALILKLQPAKIPGVNLMIVLSTVYLFQGIAILMFLLKKVAISPIGRLLFYIVTMVFFKFVAVLLIAVGFFDVWFDFRKLKAGVS